MGTAAAMPIFYASVRLGLVFHRARFPEQQGDTPDGGQTHQGIDDPADGAVGSAKGKGHKVKAKYTDAAPVEAADDGQDKGDFIHNHAQ